MAWAQTAVNQLVRVKLTQNMFDALVCFVYNIGENAFSRSTMLQLLNSGQYEAAAKQFDVWVKAGGKTVKGLVTRRMKERALFEGK
jgi:lysozyme